MPCVHNSDSDFATLIRPTCDDLIWPTLQNELAHAVPASRDDGSNGSTGMGWAPSTEWPGG
jgi:hypothetical protein